MRDLAKGRTKKARSRSRSNCRAVLKAVGAEARDPVGRRAGEKQAGANAQDTADKKNVCCSPKGCRHENSKEVTDMASAVKVVCSVKTCKEGVFMHEDCFLAWEDDIIKNLQSHHRPQQLGRLRSWTLEQLQRDLWTKRVNDVTYKLCVCRCGGYLKKDEDWDAEKDAEKQRNDGDDGADKKKKKKKGDKPGVLWAKKSCPKFSAADLASTRRFKKAASKKNYLAEPKVQVIPNPSQGATAGHGSEETSVKVAFEGTGKSYAERGREETRRVTNFRDTPSPSKSPAPCNKRASPDRDTPLSGSHDDRDIPMPLALTAAYWWINFGWRTYLDYTLYANDKLSAADTRMQHLVMCKSVHDVEKALGCHGDLVAVSGRMGEWWQEVGWGQFRSFMEHQ